MFKPLLLAAAVTTASSFAPLSKHVHGKHVKPLAQPATFSSPAKTADPRGPLYVLLDVPDNFFTVTMLGCGVMYSFSKSVYRSRIEERAWEQRLQEAREERMRNDPTLSEIELRRKEAALEWSAYGNSRKQEEALRKEQEERERELKYAPSRVKTKVKSREDEEDRRENYMNDDEINQFEEEYGIEYDPYYDDPYTEEELPNDAKCRVDKTYGDRIYENGEIFFMDKESGLFYRNGAKPRSSVSFFGR